MLFVCVFLFLLLSNGFCEKDGKTNQVSNESEAATSFSSLRSRHSDEGLDEHEELERPCEIVEDVLV